MSYLTIRHLVMSGELALEHKNYWAALSVALMLPSMCSRLEFNDNDAYFTIDKSDKHKRWQDRLAYTDWCKKYIFRPSGMLSMLGDDGPEILYSLRCNMMHEGCADVRYGSKGIYLAINMGNWTAEFSNRHIIDVQWLCKSIFEEIKCKCGSMILSTERRTFIFDGHNRDDMLLYEDLRNREYLLTIREQFEQYEESRKN